MDKIIDKAERLCMETVEKDDRMNTLRKRFTKVGGVGDLTAISILAGLPEIGSLSDEKLNRLVGISPEERQRNGSVASGADARTCATLSTWPVSHRFNGTRFSARTTTRSEQRGILTNGQWFRRCARCCRS